MNYTTLVASRETVGSIKYWINYDRIDADSILTEAQAWIYQRVRLPQMMKTASATISSGATSITLPSDYLDPIALSIPGYNARVRLLDRDRFLETMGWQYDGSDYVPPTGMPTSFSQASGTTLDLNTTADQAYAGKLTYFARPEALGSGNLTNWLTDRYPTLLRRVCTMFCAEARKEFDLFDRLTAMNMSEIDTIKNEADFTMRGMELDFNWEAN